MRHTGAGLTLCGLTPAAAAPCGHCKPVHLANSWARSVKLRAPDTGVSNPDATEGLTADVDVRRVVLLQVRCG